MENNEIAQQVVDNSTEPNANGVPGSLPGETKTETVARLYKVKIDGVESEVDEQELLKGYAHNKAASKRMEEASLTRKEAEQVLKIFKDDPKQAFKLLGKDARAFAEQINYANTNKRLKHMNLKDVPPKKNMRKNKWKPMSTNRLNLYRAKLSLCSNHLAYLRLNAQLVVLSTICRTH
jgi:hypothetical protein